MKYAISVILAALPLLAAPQTWTGQISDSMCGANHAAMGDMGKNPKDCTAACVKGGGKYVFVSNGKVFEIANQTYGELSKAAGQDVSLTGDLAPDGKTITVSKLQTKK